MIYWEPDGHDWNWGVTWVLGLPTTDPAYTNLRKIDVEIYESATIPTPVGTKSYPAGAPIFAAQFSGTTYTFKSDSFPITDYLPRTFTVKAWCINDLGIATASPLTKTFTFTPASVATVTIAEHASSRVANAERELTCTVDVVPTLINVNTTGSPQNVTTWTTYDRGDGLGAQTIWQGWQPISGTTGTISLTGFIVTILSSTVVTVKCVVGAVLKEDPIPAAAVVNTFTMGGPVAPAGAGNWITGASFTGLSSQLKYFATGGGTYAFSFGTLSFNAKFIEHPELKSTRCLVQNGNWNGSVWVAKPGDSADKPFADAQITSADGTAIVTVAGDAVTVTNVYPWAVAPSNDPYGHVRITLAAIGTIAAPTAQASFLGQTSPCTEIIFSSDGQFAYIVPSQTKALATATPWDPGTIGDRLAIISGKLGVSTPLAPAVGIFSALINATSLGTLSGLQGGLPAWNIAIELVLAIANPNFSHTRAINVSFPGFSDYTITSWTLFGAGGAHIAFTFPTQLQTNVGIGPQPLTIVALNEDGQPSTPAAVTLTIPSATSGFAVTAPAAPSYAGLVLGTVLGVGGCTITCTSYFERFGHDYKVGFSLSWITPSNPGAGVYSAVVNEIDPTGGRTTIQTISNLNAGGSVQSVTAVAAPLKAGNWTIEVVPVNADNLPSAVKQVSVAVAPNVIGSVTGIESAQYIEPGDGSKTHVGITVNLTSTNGPGLSAAAPQTLSFYFSADNKLTWFGLDWVDAAASGQTFSFESWRPTDIARTQCAVAVAIGAWAFPVGTFQSPGPAGPGQPVTGPIPNSSLPAGTVQSGLFTLALVGAPIANGVTGAQINARTAAAPYLWNSVTLIKNGTDGVTYWGEGDGVQWTNPTAAADPNLWYTIVEAWAVNASGVQAPTSDLGGVVRGWQGDASATPGALVVVKQINGIPFNVAGSGYIYFRHQIVGVSRSGQRTIQANPWVAHFNVGAFDLRYMDVLFGDPPPSSITATLSAVGGNGISVSGSTISVKVPGVAVNALSNPGFESGTLNSWVPSSGSVFATSAAARAGSFGARITGGSSYVFQPVNASAGQVYGGSVWLRGNAASGRIAVYVRAYSGVGATGSILLNSTPGFLNAGTTGFIQVSSSLTMPSGTQSVILLVWNDDGALSSGSWDVDDANLSLSGGSNTGGLGFDGSGNLKANTSTNIGVDGSGNLVAIVGNGLGLDPTTGIIIPAGTLSNVTGGLYNAGAHPVTAGFGLPTIPSLVDTSTTAYPKGSLFFDTSTGKVYRQSGGCVISVGLGAFGSGYTSAPTVSFSGGGASSQATATATINSSGQVNGIFLGNKGSGYTSTPSVFFSGGGGFGASASASIAVTPSTQPWVKDADPSDIVAGTIAAGVGYFGQVNAANITAGTMTAVNLNGGTLSLNFNGITTTINNIVDSGSGLPAGVKCQDNANINYSWMTPTGFRLNDSLSRNIAQLSYGSQAGQGVFSSLTMTGTGSYQPNNFGIRTDSGILSFATSFNGSLVGSVTFTPSFSLGGGAMVIKVTDASGNNYLEITPNGIYRNGVLKLS